MPAPLPLQTTPSPRNRTVHRLRLALGLTLGLALLTAGCGSETATNGTGTSTTDARSSYGQGSYSDASSSSDATGGGWGGGADVGGSQRADDAGGGGGGEDAGSGGQSWQQQAKSPPVAQVSLGGGKTLKLVSMRVTVRVEGLRVRVLVDHIFYNPFNKTIEGDFRYTLPPESSVSYYAMFAGPQASSGGGQPAFFGSGDGLSGQPAETIAGTTPAAVVESADSQLWGTPKVAKIQRQLEALQVYEAETEKKIDPALVEAVAPNTFQARVFPIPAKGYNRVLIAWEQTLPSLPSPAGKAGAAGKAGGRVYEYVFPLPMGELDTFDFTLLAKKAHVLDGELVATSQVGLPGAGTPTGVQEQTTAAGYLARMSAVGTQIGGKLVFHFPSKTGTEETDVLVGTDPVRNQDYAVLRLRPQIPGLKAGAKASSEQAVFLLDTSRSSHPLRFKIALQLLEQILVSTPGIKQFNIIPFDAGASWLKPSWFDNDAAGRTAALASFDGLLLEGASDVGAALNTLAKPTWSVPSSSEVDVFLLTDGAVTWGERSVGALLAKYAAESTWKARFFAYRLGLGAENLALFGRLTAQGGGIFDCLSQSAMAACATAHQAAGMRLLSATVEPKGVDGGRVLDLLVGGRLATLYPGASLTLAGPLVSAGEANVVLKGELPGGKIITHTIPITLTPAGQLAPRAWAEIAVTQLLDSGDKEIEGLAMALSQHYRIANRVASFLVLENEQTWKRYKLADETAKFSGQPLAKIIAASLKLSAGAFSTWARIAGVLGLVGQKLSNTKVETSGQKLLKASFLGDILAAVGKAGLELPAPQVPWAGRSTQDLKTAGAPESYFKSLLSTNLDLVLPFTAEAERRRSQQNDLPGAIRALSTSVERNPGSDELSRLAAYRLSAWGQPLSAAELLLAVLLRRPFEPQSWRDLASALAPSRPGLAMVLYEAALLVPWQAKWKSLKTVVREEYGLFAHGFVTQQPDHPLTATLQKRIQTLTLPKLSGDLRVTATWNTNATDIDLWVTAPNGERAWYKHKKLSTGGALLDDLTEGFGPERFQVSKAMAGDWKIEVQYFNNNGNKLVAETWVSVTIVQDLGAGAPLVSHYSVVLGKKGDVAVVDTVTFK